MSRLIHVALPHNIPDQDLPLFQSCTTYPLEDLSILQLHEAFVTYSGLCIDATGIRKESYHDYSDKRELFINDAVVQFRQALQDPKKLIELDDDETYLLIHHPWSANYWHWMTEVVLRVWMIRDKTSQMILILPEYTKSLAFVRQSLEGFAFKGIFYIPEGHHLLVRNLCMPEVKRIADSYYPEELHAIRNHFLQAAGSDSRDGHERIYISRKKSSQRKVINESEVEDLLTSYGFECINNEDFDFREQVALFSRARLVVSIHGAGLTNMMFMKEGSSILELHKRRTNDHDWHSFAFWYLADALGFQYYQQVCEPDDPSSTFFAANVVVDMERLEKNIEHMLNQ